MSQQLDRRMFLKRGGAAAVGFHALGLGTVLAACTGGDSTDDVMAGAGDAGAENLTLRMPFLADMQVPDPDIMYEGEGVQVMESSYEGLVRYKPASSEIVPGLAKSWTISDDLLTYTFTLEPNVKFHDGTIADADSWTKSFQRLAGRSTRGPPTW